MSVDSYEAALKAAAAILSYNVPGTLLSLAQLLSYVTSVAMFFTEVPRETTAKFENKVLRAAPMRNWPAKMKHLLPDLAPAIGETWKALLQRFAGKVQQANTAAAY